MLGSEKNNNAGQRALAVVCKLICWLKDFLEYTPYKPQSRSLSRLLNSKNIN